MAFLSCSASALRWSSSFILIEFCFVSFLVLYFLLFQLSFSFSLCVWRIDSEIIFHCCLSFRGCGKLLWAGRQAGGWWFRAVFFSGGGVSSYWHSRNRDQRWCFLDSGDAVVADDTTDRNWALNFWDWDVVKMSDLPEMRKYGVKLEKSWDELWESENSADQRLGFLPIGAVAVSRMLPG